MIATHSIKMNGKWYKAGEEIFPAKPQNKVAEQTRYSKTDINRMTTAELKELADKVGIEDVLEKSGGELKKILIDFFGL